jgi:hypothetical protein
MRGYQVNLLARPLMRSAERAEKAAMTRGENFMAGAPEG